MKIVKWAVACAILVVLGVRYIEKSSIYFPMKEIFVTPASAGLSYEDAYFVSSDGKRLNGWFIPADGARYTLLFCHGNAGNIGHRLHKITILHGLGLNLFVFDYRGYGKSEGSPSEEGLYRDARAAYDFLMRVKRVPPGSVILYGESIGGAVAIELGLTRSVKALITEEAFSSAKDMAAIAVPYVPYWIFASRFDAAGKITHLWYPKLLIHSVEDEIVPFAQARKLYEAAPEPKKFLTLRGGHNTAFLDSEDEYRKGIKSFLAGL